MTQVYKLVYFVPEKDNDAVKEEVFKTGAGSLGNYERCSFQMLGTGQFQAKAGASPSIGNIGKLETVTEYRVEILCEESNIREAVKALKESHPYEEVAYEVYKLENNNL